MKKLSMKFVTTNDQITTLTINEVREDITDAEGLENFIYK